MQYIYNLFYNFFWGPQSNVPSVEELIDITNNATKQKEQDRIDELNVNFSKVLNQMKAVAKIGGSSYFYKDWRHIGQHNVDILKKQRYLVCVWEDNTMTIKWQPVE